MEYDHRLSTKKARRAEGPASLYMDAAAFTRGKWCGQQTRPCVPWCREGQPL